MNTVTQALPPRQMAAAEAALLRWYPTMPLRLARAIRTRRPGYPLMVFASVKQGRAQA